MKEFMLLLAIAGALMSVGFCQNASPVYSIHYVNTFRKDVLDKNMGCGESVAYGTILYPKGPVDAVFMLTNPYLNGVNANCNRKDTFIKMFGIQQNYDLLIKSTANAVIAPIVAILTKAQASKVIIDWKFPLNSNQISQSSAWLQEFVRLLKASSYSVYVKVPASYLCREFDGKKYILGNKQITHIIVEMYGEEKGQYTTYESIFGEFNIVKSSEGYSQVCSKYPTYPSLTQNSKQKQFFIEKTMNEQEPGYIGPLFEQFVIKSAFAYNKLYFYDSFPLLHRGF